LVVGLHWVLLQKLVILVQLRCGEEENKFGDQEKAEV
jgi:hypothetical protein